MESFITVNEECCIDLRFINQVIFIPKILLSYLQKCNNNKNPKHLNEIF
jgi:hypothetical protein